MRWEIVVALIAIIATFVAVFFLCKKLDKKVKSDSNEAKEEIETVKILGTRTGEQTKILATYNFTIYSFLVVYKSGKREVIECEQGSEDFEKLIKLVDIDDLKS